MFNKNYIFASILLATSWLMPAEHHDVVPYEKVIEREYNRIRDGLDTYTSIHDIINQSLRGKSHDSRNRIIAKIRALKQALNIALAQANHDGKAMWYWGYIWKDNNASIQALLQYENDVTERLIALEWQAQSDFTKVCWYGSKYTLIALAGILAVQQSQFYLKDKTPPYGIVDMIAAPVKGGLHVATVTTKNILAGMNYSAKAFVAMATAVQKFISENDIDPATKEIIPSKKTIDSNLNSETNIQPAPAELPALLNEQSNLQIPSLTTEKSTTVFDNNSFEQPHQTMTSVSAPASSLIKQEDLEEFMRNIKKLSAPPATDSQSDQAHS